MCYRGWNVTTASWRVIYRKTHHRNRQHFYAEYLQLIFCTVGGSGNSFWCVSSVCLCTSVQPAICFVISPSSYPAVIEGERLIKRENLNRSCSTGPSRVNLLCNITRTRLQLGDFPALLTLTEKRSYYSFLPPIYLSACLCLSPVLCCISPPWNHTARRAVK